MTCFPSNSFPLFCRFPVKKARWRRLNVKEEGSKNHWIMWRKSNLMTFSPETHLHSGQITIYNTRSWQCPAKILSRSCQGPAKVSPKSCFQSCFQSCQSPVFCMSFSVSQSLVVLSFSKTFLKWYVHLWVFGSLF
jgi:hypothetical protein